MEKDGESEKDERVGDGMAEYITYCGDDLGILYRPIPTYDVSGKTRITDLDELKE